MNSSTRKLNIDYEIRDHSADRTALSRAALCTCTFYPKTDNFNVDFQGIIFLLTLLVFLTYSVGIYV